MAYEIEFIGIDEESKDADAIAIRWKNENNTYTIGVYDGGVKAYGKELKKHMDKYYYDDNDENKVVDFAICSHSDQDHASGLREILENFTVNALYMNRPWLYVDDLYDKISDGRITKESLKERLKKQYVYIAELEKLAEEKNIPIYETFQGDIIAERLEIYSPTKEFYLELLVESDKTPLTEGNIISKFGQSIRNFVFSLIEKWNEEMLHEDVETSAENEMSIVICGNMEDEKFLLTGDAGIRALTVAMDYSDDIGNAISDNVDFFQIPHHGGRHNLSPSIMNRMIGDIVEENQSIGKTAIASAAKNSDHPLKMVMNAFIRRGVILMLICINKKVVERKAFDYAKTLLEVCENIKQ